METTKIGNVERVDMLLARWGNVVDDVRNNIFGGNVEKATKATKMVLHDLQTGLSNSLRRKGYLLTLSNYELGAIDKNTEMYTTTKFKIELILGVLSAYKGEELIFEDLSTKETLGLLNDLVAELEEQILTDKEAHAKNEHTPL